MLVTPYIKMKMIEKKISESSPPTNNNTLNKNKYLPYPEEINATERNYEMNILNDEYLKAYVDSFKVYHFHDTSVSSKMKMPCRLGDKRFLREDGSNLAAFLFYQPKLWLSSVLHWMLLALSIANGIGSVFR